MVRQFIKLIIVGSLCIGLEVSIINLIDGASMVTAALNGGVIAFLVFLLLVVIFSAREGLTLQREQKEKEHRERQKPLVEKVLHLLQVRSYATVEQGDYEKELTIKVADVDGIVYTVVIDRVQVN